MASAPVAFLLADLGVTQSHSRPHVCDDNPFSEAQFKTLKYRPEFPNRFDSIGSGRPSALPDLLRLVQRRTSPYRVGFTRSRRRALRHRRHHPRQAAGGLYAPHAAHPERFVQKPPRTTQTGPAYRAPNKPDDTEEATQ